MDTSKEYIEMCQKAKEIQHKVHCSLDGCSFGSVHDFWGHSKQKDKMVWLPRQDQLQDLFVSKKAQYINGLPYITFIELFHQFVKKCWHQFNSMEQLWLAYVMDEKYSKHWDGSDWVVE